jgi:hypothetical protein
MWPGVGGLSSIESRYLQTDCLQFNIWYPMATFIAHLVNQQVEHEIITLQILILLLERPTDDSIEIAAGFT